jgi:lysophospholipase L1-like esterase
MTTLAELAAQLERQARRRFARDLARPLVYVALGASDAVGVGASTPANGYVALLADRLRRHYAPERRVVTHNLAVSGYTILDIERDELPGAPELAPDIVTLWSGGNDVVQSVEPEAFRDALTHILAGLQPTGAAVFVGTVPDMSLVPLIRSFPGWLMPMGDPTAYARRHSHELGDIVLNVAPLHGAHLVSLPMSRVLTDSRLVAGDGFHPSDAGHAQLAQVWWEAIAAVLGLAPRSP